MILPTQPEGWQIDKPRALFAHQIMQMFTGRVELEKQRNHDRASKT